MPQKITYLLIFLVSFVYGSTQPTTPRKFPEVKEKYKTLIALKARLDFMLDSLADVKYVEEVAAEVELLEWELEELERALNRPEDKSLIEFLDESFERLQRTNLDEAGAIKLFNKTYGHESISYTFGGYFRREPCYFKECIYIYVAEPIIHTYRQNRFGNFDERRRGGSGIISELSMSNDTLLYKGEIYIRAYGFLKDPRNDEDIYISMANKRSEDSENRITSYRDTTTYYNREIKSKRQDIFSVEEEINVHVQRNFQLDIYISKLESNPEQYQWVKERVEERTDGTVTSTDAESLKAWLREDVERLHALIRDKQKQIALLQVELEELKEDALLEAADHAENFFAEEWEKYYGVLDGQIVIENIGGEPYIRLKNWSVRRKQETD